RSGRSRCHFIAGKGPHTNPTKFSTAPLNDRSPRSDHYRVVVRYSSHSIATEPCRSMVEKFGRNTPPRDSSGPITTTRDHRRHPLQLGTPPFAVDIVLAELRQSVI